MHERRDQYVNKLYSIVLKYSAVCSMDEYLITFTCCISEYVDYIKYQQNLICSSDICKNRIDLF